ncbi:hypothetical protein EC973_007348 [Apophysomyces ossiformis]|uniref:NADP-dependent oxidoreductase domain-containing protein n=1 Tax=Apophysomyces ossiformis TaxID=679940 RepID=A0A8H7EU86_9FUNG|nr:hypothetical protein EC973_007348 [Apophysomyces ossiformis]
MGMSEFYGRTDDEESVKTLERALELGCTFWDTADMYGCGHNERLLGRVLKDHRDKVFLCTKFGNVRDDSGKFVGVSGKPEYVRQQFEKSLQNLGVSYVDLYYQHRVDKDTPIEETVKAMAELVKEGRVRYLGLSECSGETLRRAYKVHPIAAVQMEYSPWTLDIEKNGLLEAARELGVTIVFVSSVDELIDNSSPLGRGMLTGTIKSIDDLAEDDYRRHNPRYSAENFAKNLEIVSKIEQLAAKKGVTPSQFVLAWVLAQGPDFVVIPGTKKIKYLEQNFAAGDIQLTPEEIADMRKVVDEANVQGERYHPLHMASVNI